MFHYVYRLDNPITGEFYFGSRTSSCLPTEDNYKGSMCKWQPNKSDLIKTILKYDFESRKDANLYESSIIQDNINNPLNRNYFIPSPMFYPYGMVGEKNHFYGKTHTQETKDKWKMSRKDVSGDKNPMWGKSFSDDSKTKMRNCKIGLYDGAKNPRARKLYQYDLAGTLLKIWECAVDCTNHYENEGIVLSRGNISSISKHNGETQNQLKRLNKFVFSFGEINIERFKRFTQTHES